MKIQTITLMFCSLLAVATLAQEQKLISIHEAIKGGVYSTVLEVIQNSPTNVIEESSHELNDFIAQLPDNQAIVLSKILAERMNLAKSSEVLQKERDWDTALAALMSQSVENLSKLSKEMPLKSMKDPGGKGLLTWAIINRARPEIVSYLLELGCNVNEQDTAGNTPLLWSYLSGHSNNEHIKELLINSGADERLKNKVGLSVLSLKE